MSLQGNSHGEELQKKKLIFQKFWECLQYEIRAYAFKYTHAVPCDCSCDTGFGLGVSLIQHPVKCTLPGSVPAWNCTDCRNLS